MGLSKQEQEVVITKLGDEKEWSVYVSDLKYKRKLDKLGVQYYKTEIMGGEVVGWFYKMDEKMISIRKKPNRRELTDEEKQEIAERFKKSKK